MAAAAMAANAPTAPTERGVGDGIDSTSTNPVAVNDSGAESRTVSRPTAIETSTSPSTESPRLELGSPRFPCLYRITLPSGAPIFSSIDSSEHSHIAAIPDQPKRVIPLGKLVVSTSIEYWPSPFQEAMLCIPDGYVRLRDVDRYLILSSQARK
jgi:hypothetical protein